MEEYYGMEQKAWRLVEEQEDRDPYSPLSLFFNVPIGKKKSESSTRPPHPSIFPPIFAEPPTTKKTRIKH